MIRYIIHLWNAHKCEHVIHESFGKHPGPDPPRTWLHGLLWQDHSWPLSTTPTSIGCTIKTWLAALLWERSELSVYSSGSFPWSHLRLKISRVDFGILPTCTVRCYRASNSQPPPGWKQYNNSVSRAVRFVPLADSSKDNSNIRGPPSYWKRLGQIQWFLGPCWTQSNLGKPWDPCLLKV